MSRFAFRLVLLAGLFFVGFSASPGFADDDQDRARQALERGEIRPLDDVLAVLRAAAPGEVIKLKFEREGGRWLYKFKVLTPQNRRREVEIDARSLQIIEDENDDDD